MNIIGQIDTSAFASAQRMHHRITESTPEFPSSAGSRARGLLALKACNWRVAKEYPSIPYRQVEWIKVSCTHSSGSYFVMMTDFGMDCGFEITADWSTYIHYDGSSNLGKSRLFSGWKNDGGYGIISGSRYIHGNTDQRDAGLNLKNVGGVATISFNFANDAQIKLDGVKTADIVTAQTSATGPLLVGMNTNNLNTVLGYWYTLAFSSIKVSRGADIIRDCVAVDDGTGRGALWDKVSQTLIDATPGGTVEIGPYI